MSENAIEKIQREKRENAFIDELTALSKKHNLYIWGCGCCGTPTVNKMETPEEKAGKYAWGGGGFSDLEWEHKE